MQIAPPFGYREIVPFLKTQKVRLLVPGEVAEFARRGNAIPISYTEFQLAAREYPIVFTSGDEGKSFAPVAVLGIAARNTVVLLSSYKRIQSGGDARTDLDSVMSATRERAGAILLTAGATIAALIPLVVLGPIAGAEILQPLAVVVIGGLVSSTLLTVFVIPTLYLRLATTVHSEPSDVEPMLPPGPATVPAP